MVSLSKGQKISLEKKGGGSLTKVTMGLGWDTRPVKKSFLGGLLGGGKSDGIDLDASCIVFGSGGAILETIYFGNLKSGDGSIVHTGDNLTGEGEGDDEQIKVDLSRLSSQAESLVFTVSSYRGDT